jgi:glycosyltransferase involved in cell wall biosynthesis
VANGVDGVLVNGPNDIEGAAKAVEELVRNPDRREEMSANARRKASSLLTSKLMEQLLDRAKTILKS